MKITRFKDIPKFTAPGHYTVDYPITSLPRFIQREIDESGLQLNPDFQRGHVWTRRQQIEYIKFLLRDGNTGRDIYFNSPSWHTQINPGEYDEYVCVDGLQRITAIQAFINNEFKVFGSYFREFEDAKLIGLNTIRVHINDLKTKAEVLTWYLEMNSGGTPHSKKELERVKSMLDEAQNTTS